MSIWITESVSFIGDIASFLTSAPIFNIVGCFLLIPIAKCFKSMVGG